MNEKSKPRTVTLSSPYDTYLELAKRIKGWTASETIRRAMDLLMEASPIEDNTPAKATK